MTADARDVTAAPRYVEPPRGYWGLLLWVVLFGAGVGADAAIGGLSAHWIGWLVAAAVVIGLSAVIIRASREYKTLTIDDDEVRVGEQAVPRSAVLAGAVGTEREAPVLGWPAGISSRRTAVTLTLADGRYVVVPTRRPEQVLQTLGVMTAADATVDIRPAEEADWSTLAQIDHRAEAVFTVAGLALPDPPEVDDWADAAAIFVAGHQPVGFARVDIVDGSAHLTGIAVLPGSMRQGIGTRLLDAAVDWARAAGYDAMTLTTFADVAWNGPMYARRGWVETDDVGRGVRAIRAREVSDGLDAVGRRIAMRLSLMSSTQG